MDSCRFYFYSLANLFFMITFRILVIKIIFNSYYSIFLCLLFGHFFYFFSLLFNFFFLPTIVFICSEFLSITCLFTLMFCLFTVCLPWFTVLLLFIYSDLMSITCLFSLISFHVFIYHPVLPNPFPFATFFKTKFLSLFSSGVGYPL